MRSDSLFRFGREMRIRGVVGELECLLEKCGMYDEGRCDRSTMQSAMFVQNT